MKFVWSSGTHGGRVRKNNEDVIHPEHDGYSSEPVLVAVADGLGGHRDGEVASRIAMDSAVAAGGAPWFRVRAANTAILDAVLQQPHLVGMGTTLTMAQLSPAGSVALGHVGDTRAYLLRAGKLTRLTVDHSYVQEEVDAGRLTEEEARQHPKRHHLTRALGFGQDLPVDVGSANLAVGDRLLLCSDGLTSMLTDDRIPAILGEGPPSDAVWGLIEAANHAGGHDNVSAVVVLVNRSIEEGEGGTPEEAGR